MTCYFRWVLVGRRVASFWQCPPLQNSGIISQILVNITHHLVSVMVTIHACHSYYTYTQFLLSCRQQKSRHKFCFYSSRVNNVKFSDYSNISITIQHRLLVHTLIMVGTYQSGMYHLTLTSFSWSYDCLTYIKFSCVCLHYHTTQVTIFGSHLIHDRYMSVRHVSPDLDLVFMV